MDAKTWLGKTALNPFMHDIGRLVQRSPPFNVPRGQATITAKVPDHEIDGAR